MKNFKRRLRLAALSAGLAGAAFGQEILDPVDNLRSEYRNEVHAYTNVLEDIGVVLGPGSDRDGDCNPPEHGRRADFGAAGEYHARREA